MREVGASATSESVGEGMALTVASVSGTLRFGETVLEDSSAGSIGSPTENARKENGDARKRSP